MMLSPVQQAAIQHPQQPAVLLDGQTVSYQQWAQRISRLADSLKAQGLKQGDIGAIIIEPASHIGTNNNAIHTLEAINFYWACIEIGAVYFPINGRFSTQQINQLIGRFNIHHVWHNTPRQTTLPQSINWLYDDTLSTAKIETPHQPTKVNPHRPANIILTSGSSGTPKAAVHSLMNHLASAQGASRYIALNPNDKWLLSLPLFHIGGLAIVNRCANAGACIVIKSTKTSLDKQLIDDAISHVSMVPTQAIQMLNQHPQALHKVKALLLGGGVIEASLIERLTQQKIPAFTSYGMTEMSSQITTAKANEFGHHGRALPLRQLKLVDDIIWVKGECLFQGYLELDPQQGFTLSLPVDDQGWFCTHDRGKFNDKGQLLLLGRADNMFICGGENIQPEEIESVLLQHPLVSKAIVFGQPDTEFGLLPAAIIDYTTKQPPEDIHQQLANLVTNQLARFKRPRHWYTWPEVEQSGLKVNRKQIILAVNSQ
ncbi:o-succinylbenzoate--CoA ligase [Shewanella gaetbuli]